MKTASFDEKMFNSAYLECKGNILSFMSFKQQLP